MNRFLFAALAALALAACKEEVAGRPLPVAMTAEAVGHYCQMNLLEHPGPKAQVHLDGLQDPLFFSQVRDAIAYQRMPEQSHAITAIYVSDMSVAPSWEEPGPENWAAAENAVYVVGARVPGGMGAPELVPFTTRGAAETFAAKHGGEILPLDAIPDEVVLAPVEFALDADGNFIPPEGAVAD
jgi:copper chaperone NosL